MSSLIPSDIFCRLPERYQRRAREIAVRVQEIDALMAPCSKDDVRDAAVRLRRQLRPQPDIDPANLADEFKAACRDLPAWALSEAANDFLAGRVENHTGQFMPTCAEFAKRARAIVTPFLSERLSLRTEASKLFERAEDDHRRHLIEMEKQDPSVKARVAHLTEKAFAGFPKKQALTHRGLDADAQARLDALRKPRSFQSKLEQTKIARRAAE